MYKYGILCSHPVICVIKHSSSSNSEQLPTTSGKEIPHTRSDLRSSLQIQCPCQIYSHPGFIPYQHLQDPCWYQLGSAKGKYTNHLNVPYPIPFHVCSSHLVLQRLSFPNSETAYYPKLCPPHSCERALKSSSIGQKL